MTIVDNIRNALSRYKFTLLSQYQQGAEMGKELKKQHKEKIEKVVKKDGKP